MSDIKVRGIDIQQPIATMLLGELDSLVNLLEGTSTLKEEELFGTILRALHRLKGSTGFIGFKTVEDNIREVESNIKNASSLEAEGIAHLLIELKDLRKELTDAIS